MTWWLPVALASLTPAPAPAPDVADPSQAAPVEGPATTPPVQEPEVPPSWQVRWDTRSAVILGSLDRSLIQRVLDTRADRAAACAEGLDRAVAARAGFTIAASGLTTRAEVQGPEPVARCLADVLRGVAWPQCKGGGLVIVRDLPVHLSPP